MQYYTAQQSSVKREASSGRRSRIKVKHGKCIVFTCLQFNSQNTNEIGQNSTRQFSACTAHSREQTAWVQKFTGEAYGEGWVQYTTQHTAHTIQHTALCAASRMNVDLSKGRK